MLTSLSRSIRRLFAQPDATVRPARFESVATSAASVRPALRVVRSGDGSDTAIMPVSRVTAQPAAAAFLAGQGARLYSLDVFRRERNGGKPPRCVA